MRQRSTLGLGLLVTVLAAALAYQGCNTGSVVSNSDGGTQQPPPPECTGGVDKDGDGSNEKCDCNDNDPTVNPGHKEICDGKDNNCNKQIDEGATNACGTCDPNCSSFGKDKPFAVDPGADPNVKEQNGVKVDANGDLTLGASKQINFHYLWIANTYDMLGKDICKEGMQPGNAPRCRGSISKVDTQKLHEVARYFTVTCKSLPGAADCVDVHGKPIVAPHNHTPSRTAVDYNFDGWVANRNLHGGVPSATKIANDPADCIDRNKNGKIDTSADRDGDGKINVDCDGDGIPDNAATVCKGTLAGKQPEFLGDDDECVLFTSTYAESGDLGRSICLDSGKSTIGASHAWVGTFSREELKRGRNRYYQLDGQTGKVLTSVEMPAGHHAYGCTADAFHMVWSSDIYGNLAYFKTLAPYDVGVLLKAPWVPKTGKTYHHYGIAVDQDQNIWLGGYHANWVMRYRPVRTSWDTLGKGTWTRVDLPSTFVTRGIALDNRNKVWVGVEGGYLARIDRTLPDGVHDQTQIKENVDYWKVASNTVIGAGIDFDGNVWAVGHGNDTASRLDVDAQAKVPNPLSGQNNKVAVGRNPYTYSDFTGFGLINFVRPQGRWVYQHTACADNVKATWSGLSWNATTPAGTSVSVRVRTGDSDSTFGQWVGPFTTSPAAFGPGSAKPIAPNPAKLLQVEFTLTTSDKTQVPVLHDYGVGWSCLTNPG